MSAVRLLPPDRPAGAVPLPLLREIGDLKRIRCAGREGSIATRLFRDAWAALAGGETADEVAWRITARALCATRLADLDGSSLRALGLSAEEAAAVLRRGLADAGGALDRAALERLDGIVPSCVSSLEVPPEGSPRDAGRGGPLRFAQDGAPARDEPPPPESAPRGGFPPRLPAFVDALEAQPRAGVTCPGRGRIVLQPAESHAEHCLAVAVYGVLLAGPDGAAAGTVFLAGLAHHLHNAAMPDAGFTGEMLLGPHLDAVMRRATDAALAGLDAPLRREVERARRILPDAATPEGRAFHAADVLDRVLEIEQHLAASRLTMAEVLGPMALVHDGPVKPFHDAVLAAYGLP